VLDENGNDITAARDFKLPSYAPALLQGTPDIVKDPTYPGGGYIVYTGRGGSASPYQPTSFRWDLEGHYLDGFGAAAPGAGPEYTPLTISGSSSVNYADLDESGNLYARVINAGNSAARKILKTPRFVTGTGAIRSSPTVVNGLVFFGDSGGTVHAVEALTGQERFSLSGTGAAILGRPAVILRRDNSAAVIVFTTATGQVVRVDYDWSTEHAPLFNIFSTPPLISGAASVSTTPAIVDNGGGNLAIYVAMGNGSDTARVFRLNPLTGAVEDQSANLGTDIKSSPSVVDGSVYIGVSGGANGAYRLSAANLGIPMNDYAAGKSSDAPPFVLATSDGSQKAYLASEDGVVFAVNPATGNVDTGFGNGRAVTVDDPVTLSSGPFVCEGVVYVAGSNNKVYALSAGSGAGVGPGNGTLFFDAGADGTAGSIVGGVSITRPPTGGAAVVFGSTNGRVYQVSTTDPAVYQATLTDASAANAVATAPTVDGELSSIFVGNDNGRVFRVPIFPLPYITPGQ
jgi:outer membrane protein assembly factor BamB